MAVVHEQNCYQVFLYGEVAILIVKSQEKKCYDEHCDHSLQVICRVFEEAIVRQNARANVSVRHLLFAGEVRVNAI